MPRKLDPLWEFGEPDKGFDRINLSCKLCGKHMSRGVYRLKYHLAQIHGHDVGPCTNTNVEIIRKAMRSLEELEQKKVTKGNMKKQLAESIRSVARNNPFFQPVVDAIAVVGPGYKNDDFRGCILQDEKVDCPKILEDFRAPWTRTGCTVMSDGWTDQKGKTIINFLVSCPKGAMFIKSIDASSHIKDAKLLCDLLDVFILEVGAKHVVQVITDNAANYVVVGKMLMERQPTLFWTPCDAHCIDLMLKDIGKISFVKDIVDLSKSITKFIYNHASVLSLMRKFTNKELVHPTITRFATSFISFQSLLNSMWDVKRMFLSEEWCALTFSRKREEEAICRLVSYQENFWAEVQEVCTVIEPLVKVLQLVDGEKPAMGYLYEAMDRAKESIQVYYDDKGDEGFQKQFLWEMINERWNNTLHRPIHAAGIYLNAHFLTHVGSYLMLILCKDS
eukprot:PITA_03832